MYEVEVKVPASHDDVRRRLRDAGAERLERVAQTDTYYDAPHRDFAETDEALRLRRESRGTDSASPVGEGEDTIKVTYKGPLIDDASKTREEHETVVGDGDTAEAIFDGLGFEPAAVVEKEREFFDLDGYTVTLDRVAGLGEFIEVEAEADDSADVERLREGVFDVIRRLGLDPDDQIRTSYLGLLLVDEE
ncbi:class IV adenylate cyclase [Halobellus salinisoli]|uniref:class IV adenylate cyclase n=1 Tax=Halobellus salinisoli TaxID=3108500 RepID=UPI003008B9B7